MGIGDPRIRSGLRWSFQWKEFVISHDDVKPFSKVLKIETEFLTLKCVEKGYSLGLPNFFSEVPDLIM